MIHELRTYTVKQGSLPEVIKNSSTAITEDTTSQQDDWPESLVDDASDYKM